MVDMTGPSESGLCVLLRNTTAAVVIMLGVMTFGVWHKQDSDKAVYPLKQEIFLMSYCS